MRTLMALIALIATAPGARADCAKQFKREGASISRTLIKKGYSNFGVFDLRVFTDGIGKVTVKAGGNQGAHHRTRSTARWINEDGRRLVFVDCAWFNKFKPAERAIMAMHEFAGAAGLHDKWYTFTIVAWMLTQDQVRAAFREGELKDFEEYMIQVARQSGGGIVGVGGGGEIMSVSYKLRRLAFFIERLKAVDNENDRDIALQAMAIMLDERVNSFEPERMWGKRWKDW